MAQSRSPFDWWSDVSVSRAVPWANDPAIGGMDWDAPDLVAPSSPFQTYQPSQPSPSQSPQSAVPRPSAAVRPATISTASASPAVNQPAPYYGSGGQSGGWPDVQSVPAPQPASRPSRTASLDTATPSAPAAPTTGSQFSSSPETTAPGSASYSGIAGGAGYGSQNENPTAGFGYGSQNENPTAGFGYGSQHDFDGIASPPSPSPAERSSYGPPTSLASPSLGVPPGFADYGRNTGIGESVRGGVLGATPGGLRGGIADDTTSPARSAGLSAAPGPASTSVPSTQPSLAAPADEEGPPAGYASRLGRQAEEADRAAQARGITAAMAQNEKGMVTPPTTFSVLGMPLATISPMTEQEAAASRARSQAAAAEASKQAAQNRQGALDGITSTLGKIGNLGYDPGNFGKPTPTLSNPAANPAAEPMQFTLSPEPAERELQRALPPELLGPLGLPNYGKLGDTYGRPAPNPFGRESLDNVPLDPGMFGPQSGPPTGGFASGPSISDAMGSNESGMAQAGAQGLSDAMADNESGVATSAGVGLAEAMASNEQGMAAPDAQPGPATVGEPFGPPSPFAEEDPNAPANNAYTSFAPGPIGMPGRETTLGEQAAGRQAADREATSISAAMSTTPGLGAFGAQPGAIADALGLGSVGSQAAANMGMSPGMAAASATAAAATANPAGVGAALSNPNAFAGYTSLEGISPFAGLGLGTATPGVSPFSADLTGLTEAFSGSIDGLSNGGYSEGSGPGGAADSGGGDGGGGGGYDGGGDFGGGGHNSGDGSDHGGGGYGESSGPGGPGDSGAAGPGGGHGGAGSDPSDGASTSSGPF